MTRGPRRPSPPVVATIAVAKAVAAAELFRQTGAVPPWARAPRPVGASS